MRYLGLFFVVVLVPVLGSALNLTDTEESKVMNGFVAPRYKYPFMTSYQYRGEHFCGCTIIREQWLLTAAHCIDVAVTVPLADLRIVAGITKLGEMSPYVQTSTVLRQFKHPSYLGGISPSDIGLVRLATPLKWTPDVQFVFLPYPDDEFSVSVTEMVGWGYLRPGFPVPSTLLQFAEGYIISQADCNALVKQCNGTVEYRHICTVGYNFGNETSSEGDSGGPLILYNQNGYAIQIGILAWNVSPCGIQRGPSVSTKLSKFIDWIYCRINNDFTSPSAPCW